jgi:conjugative transfer pilus assembly protein TraH
MKHLFILLTLYSLTAHAGMMARLQGLFDKAGFITHSSGAYLDQAGGYITGGSLFARGPVENHTLVSFQPPSFGWGCGGIDLFTGSLSFISKEDLIKTLRAIGSNAASYAFSLALQQVTPQIKAVIDNLQATMQEINNANINSCRMAAQLVGGLAPQTQASTELYCSSKGVNMGTFTDYADAKHQCQTKGKRDDVRGSRDDDFEDMLGDEFNLVWKAIQKNPFLSGDEGHKEIGEFIMSLTGSIVSNLKTTTTKKDGEDKPDDAPLFEHLPSLATKPAFIRSLMGTTKTDVEIYKCDEPTKCLKPFNKQKIIIKEDQTLIHKVNTMVMGLYQKIREDAALTEEEKGFINATSMPILRILAINAAYKNDANPIAIPELVEIIAYDILLRHIESVLDLVLDHIKRLQKVQTSDTAIKDFKKDLARTSRMIIEERRSLLHHFQSTLALIHRTQKLEEYAYNKFLSHHLEE